MHLRSHAHTHTRQLHFYFLPGRVLKRLSAIHIPFFCETKCSAQVATKINKEWNIIIDFLRVFLQSDPGTGFVVPWYYKNIHKPLKIKEAHLENLACCYAQQRLQSVQSKILSHSEVKWELFSKQQNTISFPHARCRLSVDKYLWLQLCCCCSENDISLQI